MGKKSILTPVLSVVLALLILASGFIVGIKGGFFSKDKKDDSEKDTVTEFKFEGFNDTFSYLSNTFDSITDVLNGDIDAGVSAQLTLIPGDIIAEEMGVSSLGNIKISADGKVKGGMAANDIYLDYNDQRLVSLKTVTDETNAYFQIPELNDAYISGDIKDFLMQATGAHSEYTFNDGTSIDIPDDMKAALEAFDNAKVEKLLNTYFDILKDNVPKGKSNGEVSGDINGVSYKYDKKKITITEADMISFMKDCIKDMQNDSELENLFNSFMNANRNRMQEIYRENYGEEISQEELNEYYPDYQTVLKNFIDELEEADGTDDDDDSESVSFDLYYDKDGNIKGFSFDDDGDVVSIVYVDESDKFAVEYAYDDGYDDIKVSTSITGSDGKYKAEFYIYDDKEEVVSVTVNTDVDIVDEASGAFKGNIDITVTADNESLKVNITSDSTADKTDLTITASFDNENLGTVKFEAVETGASDITVPSGTIYNALNEEDMQKYGESCDFEGFQAKLKTALGDELYELFFDEGPIGDYNNKATQAQLNSGAKSIFIGVNSTCERMYTSGNTIPDGYYQGYVGDESYDFIDDYMEIIHNCVTSNTDYDLLGSYYVVVIENGFPQSVHLYGDDATGIYLPDYY